MDSYLNLMGNKLKPKEVNNALIDLENAPHESGGGGGGGESLHRDTLHLTGDGTLTYTITFPVKPLFFSIHGKALANEWCGTSLIAYGDTYATFITSNKAVLGGDLTYSQNELSMTVTSTGDAGYIANADGEDIAIDYFY